MIVFYLCITGTCYISFPASTPMHIKRIEIDGFKSYAQKQIIDHFDTQFNAITGKANSSACSTYCTIQVSTARGSQIS